MKLKLLNFLKNLIIITVLVVVVTTVAFTTSSYADYATADPIDGGVVNPSDPSDPSDSSATPSATPTTPTGRVTLGEKMREVISDWYRFILRVSLSLYAIAYLIIILKLFADRTPERLSIVKESLLRFIVSFAVISFLHVIMITILSFNEQGIQVAKKVGSNFSGIDMETDEYDLYQTALSKAYEVSSVPGFIGLIMYLLLVFYTYKFLIVYAKRYINIVVLTLLAPIIFVISSVGKILTGISDGRIKKWFKEYIFNVLIQTLHAIFYAILIGLTLRFSDNNENLVGALLTLVLFGFIFKIDAVIRKIFNFVGGNTKIASSGAVSKVLDTTELIGKKGSAFGKDVKENGFKQAVSNSATKFGQNLENGFKEIPGKAKGFVSGIGDKTLNLVDSAIDNAKDYKNILGGERVKDNLTKYEIVRQYHIMENRTGLEGLRQDIRAAGVSLIDRTKSIGKYSSKRLFNIYIRADAFTKKKIREIKSEYDYMISDVQNNYEMVKRIPTVIRRTKKKKKFIKDSKGLNMDVSNTMMLVVTSDASPEEIVKEVKDKYGDTVDVSAFIFQEVGLQVFLSSATGSSRMGLSTLAEDRYEEVAESRIDEAVTGEIPEKQTIKKPTTHRSKVATSNAAKTVKKSDKVNKVYKFNRFTPRTARKIRRRMMKKSVNSNRYLLVLNKTYSDLEVNKLYPVGRISSKKLVVTQKMRVQRHNAIKTIRQINMEQKQAVARYQNAAKESKRVLFANNVAHRVMTKNNELRIGFKDIANMSAGQIGLRNMIKTRRAFELPNDMVMVKKTDKSKSASKPIEAPVAFKLAKEAIFSQREYQQESDIPKRKKSVAPTETQVAEQGAIEEIEEVISETVNNRVGQVSTETTSTSVEEPATESATTETVTTETEQPATTTQIDNVKVEKAVQEATGQTTVTQVEEPKTQEAVQEISQDSDDKMKVLDDVIATTAERTRKTELKQLTFDQDEELKDVAINYMVSNGILTAEEAEDEDTVADAFDVLNERVEQLSTASGEEIDNFIETATDAEFRDYVEQQIQIGNYSVDNKGAVTVEEKERNFSELLLGLAKQQIVEDTKFPVGVLHETYDGFKDVINNAAAGTISKEELEREKLYDKALEEAEKKWAKRTGEKADKDIAKKIKNQGKEDEAELVKITFKFYGAVKEQGQDVTLTNRNSIKAFYDKADKEDSADLAKTQERFLQVYEEKLKKLRLDSFNFSRHPVEEMDGWAIYVVSNLEDVSSGEKEREKDAIPNADEQIDEEVARIIDKYYIEIRDKFTSFVEEKNIDSFDDIHIDQGIRQELIRKFKVFLLRKGEKDAPEMSKRIVDNLHKDIRFRDMIKEVAAKKLLEEKRKKVKDSYEVKKKSTAEQDAEEQVAPEVVESEKEEEQNNLLTQIQEEIASSDVQDLIKQLDTDKELIMTTDLRDSAKGRNKKVLTFNF